MSRRDQRIAKASRGSAADCRRNARDAAAQGEPGEAAKWADLARAFDVKAERAER